MKTFCISTAIKVSTYFFFLCIIFPRLCQKPQTYNIVILCTKKVLQNRNINLEEYNNEFIVIPKNCYNESDEIDEKWTNIMNREDCQLRRFFSIRNMQDKSSFALKKVPDLSDPNMLLSVALLHETNQHKVDLA